MKTYWVSWYHDPETMTPFTLHSPWWVTGWDGQGRQTICAVVKATDPAVAWGKMMRSYDEPPQNAEMRFVTEKPDGWRPPEDRFPPGNGMEWWMTEKEINRVLWWVGFAFQQAFVMAAWALVWAWTGSFWKALVILILAAIGNGLGAAITQLRNDDSKSA